MTTLKTRDILALGFMTFALFLGAGNIIFPPSVGLAAGEFQWSAALGFLLTGVGLPLLNPGVKNPLPWLIEVMDVKKETNFFEQKVTEYQTRGSLVVGSDDEF